MRMSAFLSTLLLAATFHCAFAGESLVEVVHSQRGLRTVCAGQFGSDSPIGLGVNGSLAAACPILICSWSALASSSITSYNETSGRKSPPLAFALSLCMPGVGQHYNGQHVKGLVQEVLFVGGIAMIFSAITSGESFGDWSDWASGVGAFGLGISAASYIWSVVDAALSAKRINRELEASQ